MDLVTLEDVHAAAESLKGVALRTPVLRCFPGGDLYLKAENLQPVGSFKLRGATAAVAALEPARRAAGVVTHSSGNHGQALAYAAAAAGIACRVVAPEGTPRVKLERMREAGAVVEIVPPEERLSAAEKIVAETGMALVPPFDSRDVIAGQGTVGLEILEDLPDVEVILVPVGGGGLSSGVATAVKGLRPSVRVIGVEPELAGDATESLTGGSLVRWPAAQTCRTLADGLRSTALSPLTFAHLRERLDDIVTVTEDQIRDAVRLLASRARLVAEPSGAVASAAWLSCRDRLPAGKTVAIVSGGNVDTDLYAALLSEPASA